MMDKVFDMAEMPVSVIIPVYNVYEWMDECMESLCNQTFHNFEMILINDGSTDGSGAKCEKWALRDSRVRYISKENEGLALTRNLGIKEAKGKYIVFVDSDDWVDPRFLEILYSKIEETGADLVECDFWRYDNNTGHKTYRVCYGRMGKEYSLEEHMIYGQSTAWKYISRKTLWTENGIEMPDCMSASHGVYALLLALSNKVANVHEALYYYRRFRKGSILDTNGKSGNQKGTLGLSALEYLVKQFHECGLYEQYKETVEKIVIYSLSDYLASQFGRLDKKGFDDLADTYYKYTRSVFPQIRNDKYILLGGYNLNRILFHVNKIHNPYCRFNFSSIISIMSPSSGVTCTHKNKYRENMVCRDVSAQFFTIVEEIEPEYLFIDLIEERFDIIEYEGIYITKSDAFDGIDGGIEGCRVIKRDSQECNLLWKQKCLEFITEVQKYISGKNIVLIKNYLSEFVGDYGHKEKFEDIQNIRKVNAILKEYYNFLADNCDGIKVVEASECPMYFTDIQYEYGAVPSHLNEIVNEEIAKEIERVIA